MEINIAHSPWLAFRLKQINNKLTIEKEKFWNVFGNFEIFAPISMLVSSTHSPKRISRDLQRQTLSEESTTHWKCAVVRLSLLSKTKVWALKCRTEKGSGRDLSGGSWTRTPPGNELQFISSLITPQTCHSTRCVGTSTVDLMCVRWTLCACFDERALN